MPEDIREKRFQRAKEIVESIVKKLLKEYRFGNHGGLITNKINAHFYDVYVEYGKESETIITFSPENILDCTDENEIHAIECKMYVERTVKQKLEELRRKIDADSH